MKLQTNIPFSPEEDQIDYASKVVLIGSCFTGNVGGKLDYFKFQNVQNPFGILFHPNAIETLVHRAVHKKKFTEADVFERDGQWFCFEAHSSLTAASKETLVELLNEQLVGFSKYVQEATHFVFTYGTAWVYRHIASEKRVANCHKLPQHNFKKEMLSVEEITASIENTASLLQRSNSNASLILTVSPVRHIKDGFIENSRSKAHLLAGIHHTVETVQAAHYFPSYELMMDELRDYRFYGDDMIHPSSTAIEYIWEKFQKVWISEETKSLQKEIATIQSGLEHRPFNHESETFLKFQKNLKEKIEMVKKKIPFVEFNL